MQNIVCSLNYSYETVFETCPMQSYLKGHLVCKLVLSN